MPGSPEAWRCFVAVPVSESVRDALREAVTRWRTAAQAPDLRWTDPDHWHVTLVFLGDTDPAEVPALARALESAAVLAPFSVDVDRIGAFPRPGAAHVVWCGFADPDHRFAELAGHVERAVGAEAPRAAFRAHLTLARSRSSRGEPLGAWLATLDPPDAALAVEQVVLFRSHRGSGPAHYEPLAVVRLDGARSGRG